MLDLQESDGTLVGIPDLKQEKTQIAPQQKESGPSVRVKIKGLESFENKEAPTKVKPFKILSYDQKPKIQHFKAKIAPPPPKPSLALKKILTFLIALTLLTSGIWFLATAHSRSSRDLHASGAAVEGAASESLDELQEDVIEDASVGGLSGDVIMDEETMSYKSLPDQALHPPEILKLPKIESLTSGYGIRLDPFTTRLAFHGGIDFKAKHGEKILASLDGVVVFAGKKGKYGNLIRIKHEGGYETRYAHLSKIQVQRGQHVKKGQGIGAAGSTGRSTGPHLHFELLKNGKRMDPLMAKINSNVKKTR